MLAEVRYRGYGPTYCTTYNILYGECATGKPLWVWRPKNFLNDAIFLLESISLIWDSRVMLNFPMVAQSPYYIVVYFSILIHYHMIVLYTILYCTILYYTVLYYTVLCTISLSLCSLATSSLPFQGQTEGPIQPAVGKGGKKGKKKSSSSVKKGVDDDALLAEAVKENSTCFFPK